MTGVCDQNTTAGLGTNAYLHRVVDDHHSVSAASLCHSEHAAQVEANSTGPLRSSNRPAALTSAVAAGSTPDACTRCGCLTVVQTVNVTQGIRHGVADTGRMDDGEGVGTVPDSQHYSPQQRGCGVIHLSVLCERDPPSQPTG